MKRLLTAAAACLALAACATATPYQPLTSKGMSTGGYSEVRVNSDRFRITFSGNSLTSRDTVERYLLYRAAEVSLAEGYDWFTLADRHTDRDSHTVYQPDPFGYDMWRPTWAYLGRGRWVMLDPWGPNRFWDRGMNIEEITRFQASAEIFMGKGKKPAGDAAAFDAHEVEKNLAATIKRPTS